MFLYEDKSYIKKSGFEMQKIGELRSMTYSCADDEKHRPSKATSFFYEGFYAKDFNPNSLCQRTEA